MSFRDIAFEKLMVVSPHLEKQKVNLLAFARGYDQRMQAIMEHRKKTYKKLINLNAPKSIVEGQKELLSTRGSDLQMTFEDQQCASMLRKISEKQGESVGVIEVIADHLLNDDWLASQKDTFLGKQKIIANDIVANLIANTIEKVMMMENELATWMYGDNFDVDQTWVVNKIEDTLSMILHRKIQRRYVLSLKGK